MGRIVIVGGSNSIIRTGWVPRLAERVGSAHTVDNLAIGGTTSLTGIYRLLTAGDLKSGDIVLWEYALNEFGHFKHGEHPIPVLMSHVEWIIRICAEAGAHLMPVIFSTRAQELNLRVDRYRQALHYVFLTHNVPVFDVCHHFRNTFDVGRLPKADFQDNFHFAAGGRIVTGITEYVADRINDIPRTRVHPDRLAYTRPDDRVTATGSIDGATSEVYSTRLIRTEIYPLRDEIRIVADGDLVGASLVTSVKGRAIEVVVDGAVAGRFSTRRDAENAGPARLVKQVSFQGLLGKLIPARGREVVIRRPAADAKLMTDNGFDPRMGPGADGSEDALIGLVTINRG